MENQYADIPEESCLKKCSGNIEGILFLLTFIGGGATVYFLNLYLGRNG